MKLSTELRRWWAIIRRKTRALYIYSGSRPVLGVFHEIRCHQANIRTFIRKDSNHAGTSVDFTIQSFNHVGRWDFSRVQHGECIEGQRIFQSIFKALNRFRQALGIGVDHIICAIISLRLFSSTPHTISTALLTILASTRTFSYSASTHKTGYTVPARERLRNSSTPVEEFLYWQQRAVLSRARSFCYPGLDASRPWACRSPW